MRAEFLEDLADDGLFTPEFAKHLSPPGFAGDLFT
jgi:hypothetical protein